MKRLFRHIKPYWIELTSAAILTGIAAVCDLLLPDIMSRILDEGVKLKDYENVISGCTEMLLVTMISLGTMMAGAWLSYRCVARFSADIRKTVFQKVNDMTFEEFGKLGASALVTRATHDVENVSWVVSEIAGSAVTIPVLFFGGVFLSFRKDVLLSLVLLAFLPVIVVAVMAIGRKLLPLWDKSDEYIDKQNDIMRQRLRGIRVIRAFNAEEKEHQRIADATRTMAEYIIKGNVSMNMITPLATFLLNAATVLVIIVGGWRMELGKTLTGGDVLAIVQYIGLISGSVVMGAFSIIMLPHAKVAADRISQVLDAEAMGDPIGRQELVFAGDIRFDHVSFRYEGATEYALKDISLQIRAGERIAVIGGTGSGKSTLVSMLLGFRVPTLGEVYLDGIPAAKLSRHTMRANISCVLQSTTIYSGTIRENILMGKEDATKEQIMEALSVAQAGEFVEDFSEGLDHVIRQSGKNLSGGQKQRLSIARAVIKDAPIFVFDDSFSALDFLTESKLRAALNHRIAGKTQIIITQRVSTAMHCHRIYVLDHGVLVGCGTHRELLETCRVYQEIHASQTGGEQDAI